MNIVLEAGRFARDPEVRYTDGGSTIARFSLAVNRSVKKGDKWEQEADFIPCVAFGKKAEFIEKYFKKGSFAIVKGNIKTGSYAKEDGTKVYTTDVWVEDIDFGGAKSDNSQPVGDAKPNSDGFMNIPDGIDEELPFN